MYLGSDKKNTIHRKPRQQNHKNWVLFEKYKVDELTQLINVVFGEMSLVGPRPEVNKYVEMYSKEDRSILSVK